MSNPFHRKRASKARQPAPPAGARADSGLLYHWNTPDRMMAALSADRMSAARWYHYIEEVDDLVAGSSWSEDPSRWRREHRACLVLDPTQVLNPVYAINGQRTYWRTQGMLRPDVYDQNAWRLEDDAIDEAFIAGPILCLRASLVAVWTDHTALARLARQYDIFVDNLPPLAAGQRAG